MSNRKIWPGFTLPELLLALSVILVVSGVSVPLYMNYRYSTELHLAAQGVEHALDRARILSAAGANSTDGGFDAMDGILYKG